MKRGSTRFPFHNLFWPSFSSKPRHILPPLCKKIQLYCVNKVTHTYFSPFFYLSTSKQFHSLHTGPFTLTASATVRAFAVAAGFLDSAVASATFTISAGGQQPQSGGSFAGAWHDRGRGLRHGQGGHPEFGCAEHRGHFTHANGTVGWPACKVNVVYAGSFKLGIDMAIANGGRKLWAEFIQGDSHLI